MFSSLDIFTMKIGRNVKINKYIKYYNFIFKKIGNVDSLTRSL